MSALQMAIGPKRGLHGVNVARERHHRMPEAKQKRLRTARHYRELLSDYSWPAPDAFDADAELWLDVNTDPVGVVLEPVTELRQHNEQKCAREARRANRCLDRQKRFKRWAKKAAAAMMSI